MSGQEAQAEGIPQAQGITLLEGEEMRHNQRTSWASYLGTINLILIIISFGMWLLIWAPVVWYARQHSRYIVTTERVIRKSGIFSTNTEEYRTEDIRQIQTGQSWKESIFGVGNLQFSTVGGGNVITFSGVGNYQNIANTIRELQR